jgi:DnaJ-class molecular chaperone
MHQVHHGPGGPEIRIFHGGFPPHMHQRPQKPAPIMLNKTISMEQAFTGCTLPIELERWVMIGEMKIHEEETLYITVPPGMDDNEVLLLLEKGNAINDQCKGDVKVAIHLENKSVFQRQGLDLIYRKSITLKEALCGFAFEIPHLNGKVLSLNNRSNPTVVKPNYRKNVQGLGMIRENAYGNLIIEFDIEFPESLTAEQIAGVEALL